MKKKRTLELSVN